MSTPGLFRTARVEVISKDGVGRVSPSRFHGSACIWAGGRIYIGACETRLNKTPISQPLAPDGDSGSGQWLYFQ